jgi:hypothetical protein
VEESVGATGAPPFTWTRGFAAGAWSYEAVARWGGTEVMAEGRFIVPEGAAAPVPVEVRFAPRAR